MIDYYYEFPEGTQLFNQFVRYAFQRGYHPEESSTGAKILHNACFQMASRIWLENANGLTLVQEHRREVHKKCLPKEMTWIKLQAREL
jgi:hypothetical protein